MAALRSGLPVAAFQRPLSAASLRRNLSAARAAWHGCCVACGRDNSQGLRLEFRVVETGQVEASFECGPAFQGYPGYLHGGVIATLLDAAMTNCLFAHGIVGLTAELKLRYQHPVRIGKAARVSAWLVRSTRRLHDIRSQLAQDGAIKVTASSRFMEADPAFGWDDPGGARTAGAG